MCPPPELLRPPSPVAVMEIRYRGVTPLRGGWQAQVTGKYLGWFPNKKQAAAKVASALRKPMAKIRKPGQPTLRKPMAKIRKRKHTEPRLEPLMPLRTHKYIYWLTKPQLWQLKLHGHKSRHFPRALRPWKLPAQP